MRFVSVCSVHNWIILQYWPQNCSLYAWFELPMYYYSLSFSALIFQCSTLRYLQGRSCLSSTPWIYQATLKFPRIYSWRQLQVWEYGLTIYDGVILSCFTTWRSHLWLQVLKINTVLVYVSPLYSIGQNHYWDLTSSTRVHEYTRILGVFLSNDVY